MDSKTLFLVGMFLLIGGVLCQDKPSSSSSGSSKDTIEIVSQQQDLNPDGSFSAAFETANGIVFEEAGEIKNPGEEGEAQSVKGSASWTAPGGESVKLSWTADENGVVFEGDHLPTPPPTQAIPEAIQKALDWIAAHPSEESQAE